MTPDQKAPLPMTTKAKADTYDLACKMLEVPEGSLLDYLNETMTLPATKQRVVLYAIRKLLGNAPVNLVYTRLQRILHTSAERRDRIIKLEAELYAARQKTRV